MTTETLPATTEEPTTTMQLLERAVATGQVDVEVIEKLVALQERQETRRAEAALIQALHEFQSLCPEVERGVQVNTNSGQRAYKYARFEDVKKTILPALRQCGLMFSHTVEESRVICRVSHRDGAVTESSFPLTNWEGTKMMNSTQKTASAISYAKRYSLIGALGIATRDDDAAGCDVVTAADLGTLFAMHEKKHGGGKDAFRAWIRENVLKNASDDEMRDPSYWTRRDYVFAMETLDRVTFDDYADTSSIKPPEEESF